MVSYGPDTFVMRVEDDSMAPRFLRGDYVYVDPDEPAAHGRYVAIRDGAAGAGVVRRYLVEAGRRVIRALHPDLPDRVLTYDNETDLRGTVVLRGREARSRRGLIGTLPPGRHGGRG